MILGTSSTWSCLKSICLLPKTSLIRTNLFISYEKRMMQVLHAGSLQEITNKSKYRTFTLSLKAVKLFTKVHHWDEFPSLGHTVDPSNYCQFLFCRVSNPPKEAGHRLGTLSSVSSISFLFLDPFIRLANNAMVEIGLVWIRSPIVAGALAFRYPMTMRWGFITIYFSSHA